MIKILIEEQDAIQALRDLYEKEVYKLPTTSKELGDRLELYCPISQYGKRAYPGKEILTTGTDFKIGGLPSYRLEPSGQLFIEKFDSFFVRTITAGSSLEVAIEEMGKKFKFPIEVLAFQVF